MKNKTRKELIEIIEELQNEIDELENDVEWWRNEYEDIEEERDMLLDQVEDLENISVPEGIMDLEEFKYRLSLENMYTSEFNNFLNHYLRFYNN